MKIRKIVSLALSVMMLASMGSTAFAMNKTNLETTDMLTTQLNITFSLENRENSENLKAVLENSISEFNEMKSNQISYQL